MHRIAWYRGDIFNYRIASELADIEKNLTRVLSQPPQPVSQCSTYTYGENGKWFKMCARSLSDASAAVEQYMV